jgi:hypothetical protein
MPESIPAAPPRRRRRRWLMLAAVLLVGAGAGFLFLRSDPSQQELREAIAEADRLDPGWRFDELEARRKPIRDEDNAALAILAARQHIPNSWPPSNPRRASGSGVFPSVVEEGLAYLPPEILLTEQLTRDLDADLADVEPALVEARKLKRLSEGRYPVTWTPDVIGSGLTSQEARPVANLLEWEAVALAQRGQAGEALATARAVLVAGRSIGDEPLLISVHIRKAIGVQAMRCMERMLAQGTPPPAALKAAQDLLIDEEAQPLLLIAFRGERGATQRAINAGHLGRPSLTQALGSGNRDQLRRLVDFDLPRRIRHMQAEALRQQSACVEAAKLPIEEQARAFAALKPSAPTGDDPVASLTQALFKTAEGYRRWPATLRCAIVALALERYRADKDGWPESLDALAPAYLPALPLDPYDGRLLRYKRLADGVLVYSVGPDGEDNGGALNRKAIVAPGTDLGFSLWDVALRRQPAAEVLPPPDEFDP